MALSYEGGGSALSVKVKTSNLSNLMSQIESKWKVLSLSNNSAFHCGPILMPITIRAACGNYIYLLRHLAMVIACLGLFGLAAYAAERETKIGIHQVLGASVSRYRRYALSMDFIKLVFISILILLAAGLVHTMNRLRDFAYRINIQWWSTGRWPVAATILIAVTISFQSIKAAIANPV